jgi:rhodanese-related sulfurtransferase
MPDVVDRHQLRWLVGEHAAQLVEVLPADEYEEEHLPGALHLPLKQLDAAAAGRILERGRPVIVYCWDGL